MRYPVWFILLMDQNRNRFAPEAATDEPASPFNAQAPEAAAADLPGFAEPPLLSDSLGAAFDETVAETFPPGCRKPRHDGWGPEQIGGFLRALAATGVVEHAARTVGRSPQSAYNFRNGRQGRAFARMWDAVLINRTRARVASEISGRAIAGCVSVRKKDGVVVSEYHYYDNRLAMSLLTRLDRLADKEAASEAHLRTLSEDLDDFIDCLAAGGDADAVVEERRPCDPEPPAPPKPEPEPDDDPDLTKFARLSGCPDYREVDPREIDVLDLDPAATEDWSADQWVRAIRSGFLTWLENVSKEQDLVPGPGVAHRFHFWRLAAVAAAGVEGAGMAPAEQADREIDTSDLDCDSIWEWTEDQLARAWRSGVLRRLPPEFWDDLADAESGEEPPE